MTSEAQRTPDLSPWESLRLLGSVPMGRIVFTERALPAIRPVNHLIDSGDVIVHAHVGASIRAAHGQVVAYEADRIDPGDNVGWSVIVTGKAEVIDDPAELARFRDRQCSWLDRPMPYVVRIHPELITGYRLGPVGDPAGGPADETGGDAIGG